MYQSLFVMLTVLGAAGAPAVDPEAPQGERIVAAARAHLDRRLRTDCSGFVLQVLDEADAKVLFRDEAATGSLGVYLATKPAKQPEPGDLAFFHDTHDRNHNGLLDDPWTHVGIVESVEGSQVTLIHKGNHGVKRLVMDLKRRHDWRRNTWLRVKRPDDPPGTRYLASELLTGFGRVPPREQRVAELEAYEARLRARRSGRASPRALRAPTR